MPDTAAVKEDLLSLKWVEVPSQGLPQDLKDLRFYRVRVVCAQESGWLVLSFFMNRGLLRSDDYRLTFVSDKYVGLSKLSFSVDHTDAGGDF